MKKMKNKGALALRSKAARQSEKTKMQGKVKKDDQDMLTHAVKK